MSNIDHRTVAGFGDEWDSFDQSSLSKDELGTLFDAYFSIFPWQALPSNAKGFDMGCGSGRWAGCVAPRVGTLHCVDASDKALAVAQRNLAGSSNCRFHVASVDSLPFADGTMDFGYSLGVLHHVPDTLAGLGTCVDKLKPGAPFLLYLYYALDNRPVWYRLLWRASDLGRRIIAGLPFAARYGISQTIALLICWPLARGARILEILGANVSNLPLAYYRDKSLYTVRTDTLDRFGTALERRFTAQQIREMMEQAGLKNIRFSPHAPFWCALGYRAAGESS